ncbi:MAG: hypothetical protein KJO43_10205 [Phycisphaerae bacterium]|nr:hypothetical protein [Phycisphaerae bacterium]NNF41728.1 hypothetical protein [Phycisphaerales bacterium]
MDSIRTAQRRRGRGARPVLLLLKFAGLCGLLGGLAALSALGWIGPEPDTLEGWKILRSVVRSVFWPCVFTGVVVTVLAGIALWIRHPRVFLRTRWFRLKAGGLVVALPALHFFARGRVEAWYAAIEAGDLAGAASGWRAVTIAFTVALVTLAVIAAVGRTKPRLGEPLGHRSPRASA